MGDLQHAAVAAGVGAERPDRGQHLRVSRASIVTDRLCGSIPITTRSITILLTSTWLVVSARTGNAVSSKAHPSPATPRRGARPGHMP